MNSVLISPAQWQWSDEYQQIAEKLRSALKSVALRIDHIGSTSVPGLVAKDVIDVQLTVLSLSREREQIVQRLGVAGWRYRREIDCDHIPPGGAALGWAKLFFTEPPNCRRINIHIREKGSANQRYALLFRDYLRNDPLVCGLYPAVKRQLTSACDSVDRYAECKDPVCDMVMRLAENWAVNTRWNISD